MATKYQDILYDVDAAHKARFDRLCREAASAPRGVGDEGIGTLGEKRMHAIIKRYLSEDHTYHEVGVLNTGYVSDVRIGNDVYEVQTGAFYPMKKKIAHYLENTDCTVTVVHPMAGRDREERLSRKQAARRPKPPLPKPGSGSS